MTHDSLLNELWTTVLARLGGEAAIAASARETKAFLRPREIKSAVDLLRIILAYCLGGMGLRSTSAWAASVGLADLSNVALLQRLRNCEAWLEQLVGMLLVQQPVVAHGRRVRVLDATTVPKAGLADRRNNGLWRLHCAYDLPSERFSFCALTDEKGSEQLDRVPVVAGEIRIADRGNMHADRLGEVIADGGDVIVRSGWKSVCWLDQDGEVLDIIALLRNAKGAACIDRPIWVKRKKSAPLALRLVAFRKPPAAVEISRAKARRAAQKEGSEISGATLAAAEWVILVTSLAPEAFSSTEIGDLYRARWRIEMTFKRLKSIIGLGGPPGNDPRTAKTWILAHLLMILLLEPHTSALEVSPRLAA